VFSISNWFCVPVRGGSLDSWIEVWISGLVLAGELVRIKVINLHIYGYYEML
jgi:hypothetical protein